uniref:Phenylalanine--tRNA ligase, chloroplastic/mitochondrial n=1 Tax=Anthurium amnicola TaxID=1678845 RepID=A0A1D1ZAQ7_9ARAE
MAKKLTSWFLIIYTILVLCSLVSGQKDPKSHSSTSQINLKSHNSKIQNLPLKYDFNSIKQMIVSFKTEKFTGASTQIFVNYKSIVKIPGVTVAELWRVDDKGDVLVDAIFVKNDQQSRRRAWKEVPISKNKYYVVFKYVTTNKNSKFASGFIDQEPVI